MTIAYLLDTDHISILQRGGGTGFAALTARIARQGPRTVAVSVISYHEQVMGCHAYINRAKSDAEVVRGYELLARIVRGIGPAPVLPFDLAAAVTLAGFGGGLRVGTLDLRIAAIADSRDLTLLTRNASDFGRVPGLRIEDWTA